VINKNKGKWEKGCRIAKTNIQLKKLNWKKMFHIQQDGLELTITECAVKVVRAVEPK
jgi:hypothetical protein